VAAVRAQAQRIDGRVLDDPQFVGRVLLARVGESAHRCESWLVFGLAEMADERRLDRHKATGREKPRHYNGPAWTLLND
jgi:hypothetical protein